MAGGPRGIREAARSQSFHAMIPLVEVFIPLMRLAPSQFKHVIGSFFQSENPIGRVHPVAWSPIILSNQKD